MKNDGLQMREGICCTLLVVASLAWILQDILHLVVERGLRKTPDIVESRQRREGWVQT